VSDSDILAALDRLSAEVRALRAQVVGRDRGAEDLLQAVMSAVGDRLWTCAELLRHVDVSGDHALASAVAKACDGNARRLGRLLADLEGEPAVGLVVRRMGDERGVALWRVSAG
jgi:hypothetical protein